MTAINHSQSQFKIGSLFSNLRLKLLLVLLTLSFIQNANADHSSHSFLDQIWSPKFKFYSVDNGLSQSQAKVIIQDKEEYIWVLTPVGVDRFNGYEFENISFDKVWERKPDNSVANIMLDNNGEVVAVTEAGNVYRYSKSTHQFQPMFQSRSQINVETAVINQAGELFLMSSQGVFAYPLKPANSLSDGLSQLEPILNVNRALINKNILWLATSQGELYSYHFSTKRLVSHEINTAGQNNSVSYIELAAYSDGIIAAFRNGSIYSLKHTQNKASPLQTFGGVNEQPKRVMSILVDSLNHLWISTRGQGLYRVDLQSFSGRQYTLQTNRQGTVSSNNLYDMFIDKQGGLWVGAANAINYTNAEQVRFYALGGSGAYTMPLASTYVSAILEDPFGKLLVGSHDSGLGVISNLDGESNTPSLPFFNQQSNFHYQLKTYPEPKFITAIAQSQDNTTWIGTREDIFVLDGLTGAVKPLDENWQKVFSAGVNAMRFSDDEKLIITSDNKILFQKAESDIKVIEIFNEQQPFQYFSVTGPFNDKYWLASENKSFVFEFDSVSNAITLITPKTRAGVTPTGITAIWIASDNTLWMGTDGDGVISLNLANKRTEWWDKTNGLPHNDSFGILGDGKDNVWIMGNKGLTRFDALTRKIQNYTVSDGLQSNEFNHQAMHRSNKGLLFFGGINGITIIDETTFQLNQHLPKTHIESAHLVTSKGLERLTTINGQIFDLDYDTDSLSFKIGAIDLLNPDRNTFSYRLVGKSDEWIELGRKRDITLLELPKGDYRLEVKSCNNEGICNPIPATMKFNIPAAPWFSTWAYLFYGFVLTLLVLIYLKRQKAKLEYEKRMAQKERVVAAELRELNKLKDQFLSNTSHELRTPLNGIIGLSEVLMIDAEASGNGDTLDSLEAINNCGKQLRLLVEDLLDFTQLQSDRLRLNIAKFNLLEIVDEITLLLKPQAVTKGLEFSVELPSVQCEVRADPNRIRQVLYNLISNAIKFSGHGKITISVIKEGYHVTVSVKDQGVGIPKHLHEKIFESFTQVDGSDTRSEGGVGLGLAISKNIVELHDSDLKIKSEVNEGAEFLFTLMCASMKIDSANEKSLVGNASSDVNSEREKMA